MSHPTAFKTRCSSLCTPKAYNLTPGEIAPLTPHFMDEILMTQIMVAELAPELRSPDFQANIHCITGGWLPFLNEFPVP